MTKLKPIELLRNTVEEFRGVNYLVYIYLVECYGRRGVVLAGEIGHPETTNPVLIQGKLNQLIFDIKTNQPIKFDFTDYDKYDFKDCEVNELVPLSPPISMRADDFLDWNFRLEKFERLSMKDKKKKDYNLNLTYKTKPYKVISHSTLCCKSPTEYDWVKGQNPYDSESPDLWKKIITGRGQFAYAIYLNGVRDSGYFIQKNIADKFADKLNRKYFELLGKKN